MSGIVLKTEIDKSDRVNLQTMLQLAPDEKYCQFLIFYSDQGFTKVRTEGVIHTTKRVLGFNEDKLLWELELSSLQNIALFMGTASLQLEFTSRENTESITYKQITEITEINSFIINLAKQAPIIAGESILRNIINYPMKIAYENNFRYRTLSGSGPNGIDIFSIDLNFEMKIGIVYAGTHKESIAFILHREKGKVKIENPKGNILAYVKGAGGFNELTVPKKLILDAQESQIGFMTRELSILKAQRKNYTVFFGEEKAFQVKFEHNIFIMNKLMDISKDQEVFSIPLIGALWQISDISE